MSRVYRVYGDGIETQLAVETRPLVALIEDDDATRTMYSLMLEGAGFAVVGAHTGAELLARLRTGPTPVAIVMDLGLPDTHGIALSHVIRAHDRFRAVPIIAVTGWSSGPNLLGLDAAPFDDVFVKPVDSSALLDALRRRIAVVPPASARLEIHVA